MPIFIFLKKSLNLLAFVNQSNFFQYLQPLQDNDMALWQKLKLGNTEALGLLYDKYIDQIFRYGMNFSADKQMVMDAIHDLFLNLYKYHKNLADTDNVEFYLCRSFKNQLLKTSNSKIQSIPNVKFAEKVNIFFAINSYEDELIQNEYFDEKQAQLTNAMNCLSKKQKQGIFLRFNEDRPYEDIAEIMNVSVQTSRTIIYRAIKTLRTNLTSISIIFVFFL